nr:hypothetical protein [uncultured Marinifilum sp.]
MLRKILFITFYFLLLVGISHAQYQVEGDYTINGNLGIGTATPAHGIEVNKRTVKFSNQHAIYRWRWGGGTDLEWKKVADIQLANAPWRCASFEVEIFNVGSNYGSSVLGQKMLFFVSARRSSSVANDNDDGLISGPVSDFVRLVKIGTGEYELQVRQKQHWREMEVTIRQTGGFDSPITYLESPVNGSTSGEIYTPTPEHTHLYTKGQFVGNVAIGTSVKDEYALAANGIIRAKEIKVEADWADFVFEDNYKLMKLSELEEFINENRHLPEIPTEKEVEENGISLGEMNSKLLQKVEEQTLYILQLQKQLEDVNKRLDKIERSN